MKLTRLADHIGREFGSPPRALAALHGLALGGALALGAWAPAAHAIPVLSPAANVVVPANTAGIYINVVTGAAGNSSTPGWDLNPWGSGALFMYNSTGGGYVTSPNSAAASLAVGTVVAPAPTSTYATNATTTFGALSGQWKLNAVNYFGFRFTGEDALIHYGYGTMIVGSTALIRTVGQLWYESDAVTAITVSAVPEASSTAMWLAGGALGAFVLRRRRQAVG